jgi:hypothetical protein
MKFEELFTPINKMAPPEAVVFFLGFCQSRADSFIIKEKKPKPEKEKKTRAPGTKSAAAGDKMVSVTPEELALLRKMKLIK